ncbi:MAG TPA: NEW3 domain-containing protein [Actinomycetota bacterium]|nr:NEW3 domain-containing protein [Actinomycetota bacterium]
MRGARFVAIVAAGGALVLPAVPARAQGLEITTPYPAVVVGPGDGVALDLDVTAPGRQRVDLAVRRVPPGWDATLRGGGFVVGGVFTDPRDPPRVELQVEVPPDARPGTYAIVVTGRSPAGRDALRVELRVARGRAGGVSLTTDSPRAAGASDATFTFDLQLTNDTPQDATFDLHAAGPPGWLVDARPTGEEQATSIRVPGGGSHGVEVQVDPPDDAVAGAYPILVRAAGGGQSAQAQLRVEITGNYAMSVSTPDERLNVDVGAGETTEVALLVRNEGTAPLTDVELSADPPVDWQVRFVPATVPAIEPGAVARVRALITPSGDALTGDYLVTVTARSDPVTEAVDLRATVRTSGLWGLVGITLIAAALGGLALVFRRYGRR